MVSQELPEALKSVIADAPVISSRAHSGAPPLPIVDQELP